LGVRLDPLRFFEVEASMDERPTYIYVLCEPDGETVRYGEKPVLRVVEVVEPGDSWEEAGD